MLSVFERLSSADERDEASVVFVEEMALLRLLDCQFPYPDPFPLKKSYHEGEGLK